MHREIPRQVSGTVTLTDGGRRQESSDIECLLMGPQRKGQIQSPKKMDVMDGGRRR